MLVLKGVSEFFGLDIGTTAIRVVQLRKSGTSKAVFRYGFRPIDQSLTSSQNMSSLSNLADNIRQTLIKHRINTRSVAVGLSTAKCFSVIKEFDYRTADDFNKGLKFKLDSVVPYENAKIDYVVLKGTPDPKKRSVFISAVENNYIEKKLDMLESINLNVFVFEPDAVSIARALNDLNYEQPIMILDVGFLNTDIVIIHKNEPRLVNTSQVGVSNIIKDVVSGLALEQQQAQQLIFQSGLMPDSGRADLGETIARTLEKLVMSVSISINHFNAHNQSQALGKIILAGEILYIPGVAEFLTKKFNIPVQSGNAWGNVVYNPEINNQLAPLSSTFSVAVGLAQR